MKMNTPRSPIIQDALDLIPYTEISSDNSISQVAISQIRSYHDHPFHLYTGERLDDMVESIRKNGILTPTIVQRIGRNEFEMLAGHNRMNAAQIAGLTTIPAIVKENLTPKEAWLYVMETNLHQRSFDDLMPSEQAALLSLQYDKMTNQGKRNDIAHELALLDGSTVPSSEKTESAPKNSRKELAERYSLSSATVARLLRVNFLISEYKQLLDAGKLSIITAVEISFLSQEEQTWLHQFTQAYTCKVDKQAISMLRQKSKTGSLDKSTLWSLLIALDKQKAEEVHFQNMKVSKKLYAKYFTDMKAKEIEDLMTKALELYFHSTGG